MRSILYSQEPGLPTVTVKLQRSWLFTVFLVLWSVKVFATPKEEIHEFEGNKVHLSITAKGVNDFIPGFKESFLKAIEVLYQAYGERYKIALPKELHITFSWPLPSKPTVKMEAFPAENRMEIYSLTSPGSTLDFSDFVILSHELGHLAAGAFSDQRQNELFADYLGLNVVEWAYKKQGKNAKKHTSFYYSYSKQAPFYVFLTQAEKTYGSEIITDLVQDTKQEFLKRGFVGDDFVEKWAFDHIKDNSILQILSTVSFEMFPEIGIQLSPHKKPTGLEVQVIPYPQYRGLNQHYFNFRDGDIITHVNSKRVHSAKEFRARFWKEVERYPVWDFIRIEVLREKNPFTLKVKRLSFTESGKELIKKQFYSWPKKKATYFTIYYKDMNERDIQEIVSFYEFAIDHFLKKYGLKPRSHHVYFFIEKAPVAEPLDLLGFPPSSAQPCLSFYLIFPSSSRLSLPLLLTEKDVPALKYYLYWFWLYLSPAPFGGNFYDLSELSRLAMFETEVKGFLFPMITTYFNDLNPVALETLKSIQDYPFRFVQWPIEQQTEFSHAIKLYDYFMSLEQDYGTEKYSKLLQRLQRQFDKECKLPTITLQDFKDALESTFGVKPQIFDTLSN